MIGHGSSPNVNSEREKHKVPKRACTTCRQSKVCVCFYFIVPGCGRGGFHVMSTL